MEQKLYDAASRLPEAFLDFGTIAAQKKAPKPWKRIGSIAACCVLLAGLGLGISAYAAEVREYKAAIRFFNEYSLSTDGLTRGEIKAVYRDISTKTFSYEKTAQVIENSLNQQVEGFEIQQESLTPQELENLWHYQNNLQQAGIHYQYRWECRRDETLGFEIHRTSYVDQYRDNALLWQIAIEDFQVWGCKALSDGVFVYGNTPTWDSRQTQYAWIAKISAAGELLWQKQLDRGYHTELIEAVLENEDGTYTVMGRGDFDNFLFRRIAPDGEELCYQSTEIGILGIRNAVHLGGAYLVQLGNYPDLSRIVKVDTDGNITDSFSYTGPDSYYYITDMTEFDGSIYLSAYCVPKLPDETQTAGGRYDIAGIFQQMEGFSISDEALLPLVQNNFSAILLVCDPDGGIPREFYCVDASIGSRLSVGEDGALTWDVESFISAHFSPYTSAYSILCNCSVFRYTFDTAGVLKQQEATGEIVQFAR